MPKLARPHNYRQKSTKISSLGKFIFWIFVSLLLCLLLYIPLRTKYWDGSNKLNLVVSGGDEIVLMSFDPILNEINKIIIPGSTQVSVSRNLGTYQLKNVWQIGENEKIGGSLLSETVTKNFYSPAYLWADKEALGFGNGLISSFKSGILPYKTNLSYGDKLRLWIFSFFVKNSNNVVIDLSKTTYLRESKLIDGERGFVITSDIPKEFVLSLSRPESSDGLLKIGLNNFASVAFEEKIIKVFEVMGFKVSSIQRGEKRDFNCEVNGQNKLLKVEVANIFNCSVGKNESEFDIELSIGSRFDERF